MEQQPREDSRLNHVDHRQTSNEALKQQVREAVIQADRSRWFLISVGLLVLLAALGFSYISLSKKLDNNYDVAWVKMYKNGTWDIEFHESNRALEVLPATVDSVLALWVQRRFSELPETVRFDYGYANQFLVKSLSDEFVSKEGYNAPQKAADIRACKGCPRVRYDVNIIDHFDSDKSDFGIDQGGIYRTNVFVTRVEESAPPVKDKRIVRIDWRLMTQDEIKIKARQEGGKDWLRNNPIGLEILAYEEFDDKSDN